MDDSNFFYFPFEELKKHFSTRADDELTNLGEDRSNEGYHLSYQAKEEDSNEEDDKHRKDRTKNGYKVLLK